MNLPVVFRPIAKQEMDESIEWYETQRAGLGAEFAQEVQTILARMASTSEEFGRIRGPIRRAILRRVPFTIQFLNEPNRIVLLAVFHGKHNPKHVESR
jgi:plasmid stabilization system protein ParE